MEAILKALSQLDVNNDSQWTAAGEPQLAAVRWAAQNQKITREEIKAAAPLFSRTNPQVPKSEPEQQPEQPVVKQEEPAQEPAARTANDPASPPVSQFETQAQQADQDEQSDESGDVSTQAEPEMTREQQLVRTIEDIDSHTAHIKQGIADAHTRLSQLYNLRDQAQVELDSMRPRSSTSVMRQYLESQKQLTLDRAAATRAANEAYQNALQGKK